MSTKFVIDQELSTVNCAKCGVTFALPATWHATFRQDHRTFYCPQGHINWYPDESDEEKLRKEVAQLQTDIERKEAYIRDQANRNTRLFRSRAAVRGQLTKVCNRVKHGVCPCCNRTFQNLLNHMTTQHPDYRPEV